MPGIYVITLLPEGETIRFYGSRGNYYQLSNGSKLDVLQRPVWCSRCLAFSEGEWIKSVQELEQEVADYSDVNSAEYRRILESKLIRDKALSLSRRLSECEARLDWRKRRTAAPKCLECGTTDIVDSGDGLEIPSPCSSGTLTVGLVGMCSTAFRNYYYTTEGDRIPMETQPTRWTMRR